MKRITPRTLNIIRSAIECINSNPETYNKEKSTVTTLVKYIKDCDDIDSELSVKAICDHKGLFEDEGFVFPVDLKQKKQEQALLVVESAIKYISRNPGQYDKKKAQYASLERFIEKCDAIDGEISSATLSKYSGLFEEEGFVFDTPSSKEMKVRVLLTIKSAIEYINSYPGQYDKKKTEYSALAKFIENCEEIDGKISVSALIKYKSLFEEKGFIFVGQNSSKVAEQTNLIVKTTIKYINSNPGYYDKKKATYNSLAKFIENCEEIDGKISAETVSSRKSLFESEGFEFKQWKANTKEQHLSIISSAIEYINSNPGLYDRKNAEYASLAKLIRDCDKIDGEMNPTAIRTYRELFEDEGFVFVGQSNRELAEQSSLIIRSAIDYINNNPKLYDKKKATLASLARFIKDCNEVDGETSAATLVKNKNLLEDEGFVFPLPINTREQILHTVRSAIKYINSNPKAYDKKKADFSSLSRFVGVHDEIDGELSDTVLKSYKDLLEKEGFVFSVVVKREKDTQHLAVNVFREHFKNQDIRFNSPEAFRELCSDFYNTTIKIDIVTGNFRLIPYPQVVEMENDNIINVLQDIIEEATSNQDSFLLMEIKAHLLARAKIYLDEKTILNVLHGLELSEMTDSFEGLKARFRLSETLIGLNVVGVIFSKSLPRLNCSDAIVLHQKLRNKKYFKETWQQYCKFIISHSMESYTGKLEIKDKLISLEDLRENQKDGLLLSQWQAEKFNEHGIELLAAMTLYPKKTHEVKAIPNQHKGVIQKVLGYFIWLYYQGLALLTPRIIKTDKTRNSHSTQTKLLDYFADKNNAIKIYRKEIKNSQVRGSDFTHLYAFCHSINNSFSAKELSQNTFDDYVETCGHYINSGNKRHINFMHQYMRKINNHGITNTKKQKSVHDQFVSYASSVSNTCLEAYNGFIRPSLSVIEDLDCSAPYKSAHIRNIVFLLEYIDDVHDGRKLSRKEFGHALNPKDREDNYMGIREWAISLNAYRSRDTLLQETKARGTFDEILHDEDNPYYDAYSEKWKSINATYESCSYSGQVYIERVAHDRTVSSECARVCLNEPPLSSYPLKMTTGDGEPIDMSWWKKDVSPVPVFLIFIGVTIPLRWIQVRHLDLRTFFRTTNGDIDGEFDGFYINTDKNTSRSDPYIISATIVKKLLRPHEIEAIRNYIKYARKCYGYKPVCAHETQSERYPDIQPLFPHHDISANKVFDGNWLEGYLTKVMCVSAINIRNDSEEKIINIAGVSKKDPRYSGLHDKYQNLQLVMQRAEVAVPKTIEAVNGITDYKFRENFKPYGGTHSWRHTGITSLARLGWPTSVIKQITGHASILTILQVYERLDAEDLLALFDSKNFDFEKMIDMNPLESGYEMQKAITRATNTLEKSKIIELLKEAEFVGTSGYIQSGSKELFGSIGDIEIGDPVEFAAQYHPLHEWKVLNEGICPVNCNCPGQSMACGNCPLLISSPLNLGAIMHRVNLLGIQVSDNNNILRELRENRRPGSNNRLEELTAKQVEYFDEYVGWLEKLEKLRAHIVAIRQNSHNALVGHNTNATSVASNTIMQFANQVPIDEAYLNVLADAYKKHLEGFDTDRIKNRAFALMITAKTQKGDIDANELSMQFLDKLIGQIGLSENKHEKIAMICDTHFRTVGGGRLASKENMLPWNSSGILSSEEPEEAVQ